MRISLIGAGRVATHLAKALHAQHHIVNIYSRRLTQAETLAKQVGAKACNRIEEMLDTELVIVAVSDQSIVSVVTELSQYLTDTLIVHTSGSTHIDVISTLHSRVGVLYPLQTFSLEREVDWQQTPIFVEAKIEDDLVRLKTLAENLSQRVYQYDSNQRLSLHLAAVFACNFANYCYDVSKQIVDDQKVDFSLLYPLMLETASKATKHAPKDVQTGPAVRGDLNILDMHQHMLTQSGREDLKEIYSLMSQGIFNRRESKN